jgi:hypothetical protein
MSWELVLGLLPLLILLACPLHMWWMMRHMSHGESCGHQADRKGEGPQAAVAPTESAEQEIRLLKERIVQSEAEQRHAKELWK